MNELTRAINAAHTTLYNSINALNALNFNKFVENVSLHINLSYSRLYKNQKKFKQLKMIKMPQR